MTVQLTEQEKLTLKSMLDFEIRRLTKDEMRNPSSGCQKLDMWFKITSYTIALDALK